MFTTFKKTLAYKIAGHVSNISFIIIIVLVMAYNNTSSKLPTIPTHPHHLDNVSSRHQHQERGAHQNDEIDGVGTSFIDALYKKRVSLMFLVRLLVCNALLLTTQKVAAVIFWQLKYILGRNCLKAEPMTERIALFVFWRSVHNSEWKMAPTLPKEIISVNKWNGWVSKNCTIWFYCCGKLWRMLFSLRF